MIAFFLQLFHFQLLGQEGFFFLLKFIDFAQFSIKSVDFGLQEVVAAFLIADGAINTEIGSGCQAQTHCKSAKHQYFELLLLALFNLFPIREKVDSG